VALILTESTMGSGTLSTAVHGVLSNPCDPGLHTPVEIDHVLVFQLSSGGLSTSSSMVAFRFTHDSEHGATRSRRLGVSRVVTSRGQAS